MTFPVKWYSSDMEGAPLLSSGVAGSAHTTNPGSLIALLKAVLVTGFGIKSVSSLTYDSVAQTITAVVAAGHKYLVDQIVELSGANESGFNGEFRVTSITSTTVVMGLDNGTPSAASATGTLSMKIPSLGWAVEFEDAVNYKIIFKRSDAGATPIRLYIDNSAWTGWNNSYGFLAKVLMIENPTDISTFTTVYEARWPCSHNYGTPDWALVGDSLLFFFMPMHSLISARGVYTFGDINSVRAGDNYHCLLTTYTTNTTNSSSWAGANNNQHPNTLKFSDTTHKILARSYHQLPGPVAASWKGLNAFVGEGMTFPNPSDNGFYVSTDKITLYDDSSFRGYLPGMVVPFASPTPYDKGTLKNLPNLPNGLIKLWIMQRGASDGSLIPRLVGFDIKGPWR